MASLEPGAVNLKGKMDRKKEGEEERGGGGISGLRCEGWGKD